MNVFLQCPVCGKLSKLDGYDPSTLDDDIYVKTVTGLGRGRGFKWSPPKSVLGDKAVTPLIAHRTLDILAMLVKAKSVNTTDVLRRIGVKDVVSSMVVKEKDGLLEESGEEVLSLKSEVEALKERLEHRTQQAKKLFRICKSQKRKINEQRDLIVELGFQTLEE